MFLMQIPVSVVSSLTSKHHAQIVGRFTWVPSPKGRFTLWPKVERPSISTNQIVRNRAFNLSTLHTKGQCPKVVALQNAYMTILFDQGDGLLKEGWVGQK